MEWLNLKTSMLHAPEYIGSAPSARAAWVNVILWSADQENGGRIIGARSWGNRQWQQTCGVTKREVDSAPLLLIWQADDLTVWGYPAEKEEVVRKRREIGRVGGIKSGEVRGANHQPNGSAELQPNGSTERKGIGKEGNGSARGGLPGSLNTPAFRERWIRWQTYWSDNFNYGNPMPEMTAYQQLEDMVKIGEMRAIEAINNSIAKGNLRKPSEPFNGTQQSAAIPVRQGQNVTGKELQPVNYGPLT